MPLMSISKVYKAFPSYIADKVSQQARKRRESYGTGREGDELDDEEVTQASNYGNQSADKAKPPSLARSRVTSRPPSRVLRTKRSDTPLAAVSDNESDGENSNHGNSSRSRGGSGSSGTAHAHESGPLKRESPRPVTAGYFTATVSYLTRPKRVDISPRTAVSLDNVDLWEESDSECDSVNDSSGHFDRINGVTINPRMTIDLAMLRRSRSPVAVKRNRLEQTQDDIAHAPSATSSVGIKDSTGSSASTSLSSLTKSRSYDKLSRESRTKPRALRANRKMINKFSSRESSSSRSSASVASAASASASSTTFTREETFELKSHVKPRDFRPLTAISTLPLGLEASRYVSGKIRQPAFSPARGLSKTAGKDTSRDILHPKPKKPEALQVVSTRDSEMKGSNDSGMSSTSPDRKVNASTSPDRKVKFSSFVTVRGEGQQNSLDKLRESHNSAQIFKQMYLPPRARPTAPATAAYDQNKYHSATSSDVIATCDMQVTT